MKQTYRGSCLCGRVTFTVHDIAPRTANCHCRMCRKFHGAAFATLATVDLANIEWLSGESSLRRFVADNGSTRTFCENCGSSLAFHGSQQADNEIEIALGVFDDAIPVEIDAHIFTAYGADWHNIDPRLPRHPEGRDSPRVDPGQAKTK